MTLGALPSLTGLPQNLLVPTDLLRVLEIGVKFKKEDETVPSTRDGGRKEGIRKTTERVDSPATRPDSPGASLAVVSQQVYGNAEKLGIRAAFAAAARCGPLVYLDDTGVDVNSSATAYFIKNGYNTNELHPVNFNARQCFALSSAFEVDCVNMDMAAYLKMLPAKSVGGVWIDLMGYTVSHELVVAAMLSSTSVVTLTFTSAHAPSAWVDEPSASVPFTDQYARKVLGQIKSFRLGEEGRAGDVWQCTSLQVYGSATRKRDLNMINLQFQRKEVLGAKLCTFDASRPAVRRLGRIITNVSHDHLYSAFSQQHTISEEPWETVLPYIVPGARLGVFFEQTESTAMDWYVGRIMAVPTKRDGDGEWSLRIDVHFEGEGSFTISLRSADYLTTPHEPGRSWVLLESQSPPSAS